MYFFNPHAIMTSGPEMSFEEKITVLKDQLENADAIVIGAGSVVTRNIPPNSVAAGVPCRVLRSITEEDRMEELTR